MSYYAQYSKLSKEKVSPLYLSSHDKQTGEMIDRVGFDFYGLYDAIRDGEGSLTVYADSLVAQIKSYRWKYLITEAGSFEEEVSAQLGKIDVTSPIDETMLYGLTPLELRLLRNEIFARHNVIFGSEDLTHYFSQFSWYAPSITSEEAYAALTETERSNIELLRSVEK